MTTLGHSDAQEMTDLFWTLGVTRPPGGRESRGKEGPRMVLGTTFIRMLLPKTWTVTESFEGNVVSPKDYRAKENILSSV